MFETGMKETVQWYLDNTAWVDKIRARMSEISQHIKG
jgi:dTDP-D-glucose 4,6-dehydratase